MIFNIINLVLILLIFTMLIIQAYNDNQDRQKIERLRRAQSRLEKRLAQLNKSRLDDVNRKAHEGKKEPVSIVDLREFHTLDPVVKQFYKQYFTDKIMKAAVAHYNKTMEKNSIPTMLKQKEQHISKLVDQVVQEIQSLPVPDIKDLNDLVGKDPWIDISSKLDSSSENRLSETSKSVFE